MEVVLQVIERADGRFAVRSIGGSALNTELAAFATRIEAEEWMLRETLGASTRSTILRPGDGQAVA